MKQLCRKVLFASVTLFVSFQFAFAQLPTTNTFPPTGKAGIGTTNPLEAIHITEGTIRIDQAAFAGPEEPILDSVNKYALAIFDSAGNLVRATEDMINSLDPNDILNPELSDNYWRTTGNPGIVSTTHYLGTNNLADLRIRTNSQERMSITSDGYFNIGTVNDLKGMNLSVASTAATDAGLLVNTDNVLGGYGILSNVTNGGTKALSVQNLTTEKFYITGNGQGYLSDRLGLGMAPTSSAAIAVTHNDNDGGIILNRNSATTGKSQVIFQQSGVEKWTIGTDMIQDNSGNFFIYDATAALPRIFINAQGNVGIGTTSVGVTTRLAVEGKICAREIKVLTGTFPDYVFESDYKLMSLKELENYINENKHLPGVPSAQEVEANQGIELGEMNRVLLEKVEELTLHLIQLQKEVEALKAGK